MAEGNEGRTEAAADWDGLVLERDELASAVERLTCQLDEVVKAKDEVLRERDELVQAREEAIAARDSAVAAKAWLEKLKGEAVSERVMQEVAKRNDGRVPQSKPPQDLALLRAELLAARKELSAAKALPSALEKERDGLRKELEKVKSRLKDADAKLKTSVQDKNDIQMEKTKMEAEVRKLRTQGTQLTRDLSRRESMVDRRRESMAVGLNKAKSKQQEAEEMRRAKAMECERLRFDLQVLQERLSREEVKAREMEASNNVMGGRLGEMEGQLMTALAEKGRLEAENRRVNREAQELEQQGKTLVDDLKSLQLEYAALTTQCESLEVSREEVVRALEVSREEVVRALEVSREEAVRASTEARDLRKEVEKNAQQLTALHLEREDQRAMWFARESELAAEAANLQAQLQEAVAKGSRLRHQVQALESELDLVTSKMVEAVAEVGTLQRLQKERDSAHLITEQQLQQVELIVAQLKDECGHCKEEIEQYRSQVPTVEEKAREEERMAALVEQNVTQKLRIWKMEDEAERVKASRESSRRLHEMYKKKYKRSEEEKKRLETRLLAAEEDLVRDMRGMSVGMVGLRAHHFVVVQLQSQNRELERQLQEAKAKELLVKHAPQEVQPAASDHQTARRISPQVKKQQETLAKKEGCLPEAVEAENEVSQAVATQAGSTAAKGAVRNRSPLVSIGQQGTTRSGHYVNVKEKRLVGATLHSQLPKLGGRTPIDTKQLSMDKPFPVTGPPPIGIKLPLNPLCEADKENW